MKLPGFHFRETMSGSYTKDGATRPMRFSVTARAGSLLAHLVDHKADLDGEVTMEGFASQKELHGNIVIDPLLGRRIRYEFTFDGDDGERYRFIGQKDVSLADPVGSMTTLPAEVLGLDGKQVATCALLFETKDLPRFLGTFRLDF